MIIVKAQAELDAAIAKNGDAEIELRGDAQFSLTIGGTTAPYFRLTGTVSFELEARESSQPRVEAWGSSQPRVVARESSQPRVEAWGSSQPRVVARESSQPRVVAWESSQPRVEAWESSQPRVVAWESSQPRVVAWGSSQPRVEAWESSQPRVVAWESSQPRVVARGSSQPRVEAWGSSQPRVEAWGSSQPRVVAWGFTLLSIFGRVLAKCAAQVCVTIEGPAVVEGGHQVRVSRATAQQWCDYYGVSVLDGIALLYKAVNSDFRSPHGANYTPGTIPVAPDWDGGTAECGGGLHFSPSPAMAREFHPDAVRYLACPVALADIAIHPNASMPQKIKARGCAAPTYEVNEDGEPVAGPPAAGELGSAP